MIAFFYPVKQKVALDQKMFEIMNMEILLNVSIVVPGKAKPNGKSLLRVRIHSLWFQNVASMMIFFNQEANIRFNKLNGMYLIT